MAHFCGPKNQTSFLSHSPPPSLDHHFFMWPKWTLLSQFPLLNRSYFHKPPSLEGTQVVKPEGFRVWGVLFLRHKHEFILARSPGKSLEGSCMPRGIIISLTVTPSVWAMTYSLCVPHLPLTTSLFLCRDSPGNPAAYFFCVLTLAYPKLRRVFQFPMGTCGAFSILFISIPT